MKTNSLLLLASFVVVATGALAAQSQTENDMVVLPTYTVSAPRYTPVEKQINASLDEMRLLANTPVTVPAECLALKAAVDQPAYALRAGEKRPARVAGM